MIAINQTMLSLIALVFALQLFGELQASSLSPKEVIRYREKVKSMFYHAYNGYIHNAFEFDELKPISCVGMDTWGSFQLTTIDALDTLIILRNHSEFKRISDYILNHIDFDQDINVSVFETNIRVVGGLLSAHLLSHHAQMDLEPGWPCTGPLLRLAETVARKLLPAFDTATGMPYGTVNLKHGVPVDETPITCAAGVGTFIVEFGTLSRLTGDDVFEKAAMRALKSLHSFRSGLDLVGNHIDTSNGNWIALDSTIGAGVDSYFEYLVKGTFLLKDSFLMDTFHVYYDSIKKHMKKDDWHFMVHMNNGLISQPTFQSLEAFWPGLLSLIGNLDEAKKILLNYHQVWKQYGFMPEFYDIFHNDIRRNGYPLRPEFIESIFYLYKATEDPLLLKMGAEIIESIESTAKTDCGYATIKDVHKHVIEDRMESFFIAETVKYLYLLFDHANFIHNSGSKGKQIKVRLNNKEQTCILDSGGFIFNTEAHPVDIAALDCCYAIRQSQSFDSLETGFNQTTEFKRLTQSVDNLVDSFYSSLPVEPIQELNNNQSSAINVPTSNHINTQESVFEPAPICFPIDSFNSACDYCYYDLLTCPKTDFLQTFSLYGQVLQRERTN